MWTIALAGTAIVLVGVAVVAYNRLVRDRQRVLTAWSDIDVQLKRRHDLVPKLVEAVRAYADYEKAALGAVTELRAEAARTDSATERGSLESALGLSIGRLIAVAEAYPELKASAGFLDLQDALTEVENEIQHARRFYNGAVRALNVRVESFPDALVARAFGFSPASFFEFEPVSREAAS